MSISISEENNQMPFWRNIKSKGRKNRKGKYGLDIGDRGIYDTRNRLNELTGKEWIYFTNSIWITAFPPTAGKETGFDIRKIHPSPKPPELMKDIINFFTKRYEWVLDPFAGVGGTLIGASLCAPQRNCVGIDLNYNYKEAYEEVCKNMNIQKQEYICDDSRNMLDHEIVSETTFDLIVTDPPYSDMMLRPKNGQKKKLYGENSPTPFSLDTRDIGNLAYEDFLNELVSILSISIERLKEKGYLVIFCRDLQPTEESPNILHADIITKLHQLLGIRYRGMRIWHDQSMDLYPFGYPYAFVMNQMHQYILIFRKEK